MIEETNVDEQNSVQNLSCPQDCPQESMIHIHSRYDDEDDLFVVLMESSLEDLSHFDLENSSTQLLNFHLLLPSHQRSYTVDMHVLQYNYSYCFLFKTLT